MIASEETIPTRIEAAIPLETDVDEAVDAEQNQSESGLCIGVVFLCGP